MKDRNRIATSKESEKEIDLIAVLKALWEGRRLVFQSVLIFSFLGLLVAIFSEKEYVATTVMAPQVENQTSNLRGLSSLASLAGVNMDMNTASNTISPMLYPMIVSSTSFQLEVMNAEYLFKELDKPISLLDYYLTVHKPGLFGIIKKYTIGLPGLIKTYTSGEQSSTESNLDNEIYKPTTDQDKIRKIIGKKLGLEVNEAEGYFTLSSSFHQAHLSAQVTRKAQELLQEYVTQFKVEKAKAQLEFIKERYEENRDEFEKAQSKLATFRDANKNISSEMMRTQEERLQYEYQLAFEVYSELAKQLEQSLIKVEEDTPIFSIITEVTVPIEKSKPKRILILFVWIFLGGVFGIGILIAQNLIKSIKTYWKEMK